MRNLKLELPPKFLLIDTDSITPAKIDEIAAELGQVNKDHSIFGKYPMEEFETIEQWQERVMPLLAEETKRKDDESNEVWLLRAHTVKPDKLKLVKDTLAALAKVFGQAGVVNDESFNRCGYPIIKKFIRDVLKECDFDTKDFE